MGISSSKSSTKPIYKAEIEGAARTQQAAYNANSGNIQGVTNQITGLIPSLIDRYREGDPALNASRDYITSTLSGDPKQNPYLDDMLDISNGRVRNEISANMGTRGLTGGTVMQDILGRGLAENETGMRYQDYSAEMARRAQAASMGPGVSAAQTGLLDPAFNAAGVSMLPIQAATANSAGIGGLLGQYTNTKTTNPWGGALLGGIASGLGSYFGARG